MSCGLALLDYDGDGLLDIYLTDAPTVATAANPKAARSVLYRNLGNWKFAGRHRPGRAWAIPAGRWACARPTSTATAGRTSTSPAFGRNTLYHNNGDGTFTDITDQAGVAGSGWSMGCGFADYDRDGDLDLFVSRYVRVDLDAAARVRQGHRDEGRGPRRHCQ